jgi:hypothetical protein
MNCIGGIQGLNGLGPWRLSLNGRRPETTPHIMNTPCHLDPSCDLCQSHPRPSAQALIVHLHGFERDGLFSPLAAFSSLAARWGASFKLATSGGAQRVVQRPCQRPVGVLALLATVRVCVRVCERVCAVRVEVGLSGVNTPV